MKFPLMPLLACLVCGTRLQAAASEAPAAPAANQADARIEMLLRGLSDENFQVREKSTRELWDLGETALPALRDAASSSDPEQAIRARDLMRKIQLHITPDTDPSVISLVESYRKASQWEKASLLGKMRARRAWRQMLKLYATETNPELRERLRPMMGSVATRAARERLMLGDDAGAREFLEMAPADSPGLLALADFHRSHGTLEKELKRANGVDAKAALWRTALQRAAGNPAAARDEALAAGDKTTAAVMAALAGDPLPFLDAMSEAHGDSPVTAAYASIAARRWKGAKIRRDDLDRLTRMASSREPSERTGALGALFLTGHADLAEPLLVKSQPLVAFKQFDALERVPDALRALGLDPAKPDFKAWVAKTLDQMAKEDIGEQSEVSDNTDRIIALANFLERRGLHETALEAFGPPLAAMAEKDSAAFTAFLGSLFGGRETLTGAPRLARTIGAKWAGEDDSRWQDLLIAAFGDEESNRMWWDWLAEIRPDATRAERFDALLALSGIGPDPANLRAKWTDLLWSSVEKTDPSQRQEMIAKIADLASETGDVATSLKARDQQQPEERARIFWGLQIVHLSAAGRWNEAADVILKQITEMTEAKQEPSADLHAYAASALRLAGREEEAARHDQWADRMTLGDAGIALRVGNGYAFGRDYPRAAEWWARAAMLADPDSDHFAEAIKLHADALLEQGKWQETASVSEVVAAIYSNLDYQASSQLPLMNVRLQADMARALARLSTDRAGSLAILARCHHDFASDGSLADFFFPAIRKAGLLKEHDAWFLVSWNKMEEVISRYPECDNSLNTAAWFAARALRKLDTAERYSRKALSMNPCQSAYLDTMAEIQFARGHREKALAWSQRAVNFKPADTQLRRQQDRFRSEPFPR